MGLNPEQMDYCHKLKVGEGVVKISGRMEPILIQIPHVRVVGGGKETIKLNAVKPRVRPISYENYLNELAPRKKSVRGDEDVGKFLLDIAENPFTPTTERYKRLGLSMRKGNRIKEKLISEGMIKEIDINLGRSGGRRLFLELTDSGMEKLGTTSTKRFGGLEHRFWINRIKQTLEGMGHECIAEYPVGNKRIDLLVDGKTAIELEMSPRHALENIEKCEGFDLIVLCRDRETLKQIRKLDKNISLHLIRDFLSDLEQNGAEQTLSVLNKKRK